MEHPPSEFDAAEARKFFAARGYEVVDRLTTAAAAIALEDDASAFPEGKVQYRLHRRLERDVTIVRKAKARRLADTGRLQCDVCVIDFKATYGSRGKGFIKAHHTVPVATLRGEAATKISDIALVCSNCHRMLHRGTNLLSVDELRAIVEANSSG